MFVCKSWGKNRDWKLSFITGHCELYSGWAQSLQKGSAKTKGKRHLSSEATDGLSPT